jgi:hypothetical protein
MQGHALGAINYSRRKIFVAQARDPLCELAA